MFNKKNDSLVDSVKAVMEQNDTLRRVEAMVNEHFGVSSRSALPHELHAEYDAVLAEAKKCGMYEEDGDGKDTSGLQSAEYHRTMAMKAHKAMQKSGADKKTLATRKALHEKLYRRLTGKKIEYSQAMNEELHGKQWKLDKNRDKKITATDMHLVRKHGAETEKPEHVAEQSEAQKEKVKKVMGEYKRGKLHSGSKRGPVVKSRDQAIAIALNQAGLSKKTMNEADTVTTGDLSRMTQAAQAKRVKPNGPMPTQATTKGWEATVKPAEGKKPMKEDIQSLLEEMRSNLEEELAYVFENYDEATFNDYVNSLTEEQLEILGLMEEAPLRMTPQDFTHGKGAGKAPYSRETESIVKTPEGTKIAPHRGTKPEKPMTASLAPINVQQRSAPVRAKPTVKPYSPKSVPTRDAVETGISASGGQAKITGYGSRRLREAFLESLSEEQLAMLNELDIADKLGDYYARGKAAVQNLTGNTQGANKTLGDRFTNKEIKDIGGKYQSSGNATRAAGATPTQRPTSVAPQRTAPKPAATPSSTPSGTQQRTQSKKFPEGSARLAQKTGLSGKPGESANDITKRALGVMQESTSPVQVKESFESFLRNKFLKG